MAIVLIGKVAEVKADRKAMEVVTVKVVAAIANGN